MASAQWLNRHARLLSTSIGCWIAIGLMAFGCGFASSTRAETAEAKLKVAFLYNFAKFVTWPEPYFSSQPGISLCVLGEDPFGEALASLKQRTAQGRPLSITVLESVDKAKSCNVVFVSASEKAKVPQISQALTDSNALTVSDITGFAEASGIIELVNTDGKIAFDVNLDNARKAGLNVSSQLLKVARAVHAGKAR